MTFRDQSSGGRGRGFTLIELLVVIGIIAVLMAILLPSLGHARAIARATKCGAQMHSVGIAIAGYCAENFSTFPASYLYPLADGTLNPANQGDPNNNGYAHWSYFLNAFNKDIKAYTCPEMEYGGVPPGRIREKNAAYYWCSGQKDFKGNTSPTGATVEDLQAPFMAFNGECRGFIPRNKFAQTDGDTLPSGGARHNRFVKQPAVERESSTVLLTEFNSNWKTIVDDPGTTYSVSHRPVDPFITSTGSTDEYNIDSTVYFQPTSLATIYSKTQFDAKLAANADLIDDDQSKLNAIGRHHPGSYTQKGTNYGGSA